MMVANDKKPDGHRRAAPDGYRLSGRHCEDKNLVAVSRRMSRAIGRCRVAEHCFDLAMLGCRHFDDSFIDFSTAGRRRPPLRRPPVHRGDDHFDVLARRQTRENVREILRPVENVHLRLHGWLHFHGESARSGLQDRGLPVGRAFNIPYQPARSLARATISRRCPVGSKREVA